MAKPADLATCWHLPHLCCGTCAACVNRTHIYVCAPLAGLAGICAPIMACKPSCNTLQTFLTLCLSLSLFPLYVSSLSLSRMAENSRNSKLSSKDDECVFSWKLFTGWDFMIGK